MGKKVRFLHACSYLRYKHKLSILACLSDFMTCNTFGMFSEMGSTSISQLQTFQEDKHLVYMFFRHSL